MTATSKTVILPLDALADALGVEPDALVPDLIRAHGAGRVQLPILDGVPAVEFSAATAARLGLRSDGAGSWWIESEDRPEANRLHRKGTVPRTVSRDFDKHPRADARQRPVWELASEADRPEGRPLPGTPRWPERTRPAPPVGPNPGARRSVRPEDKTRPDRARGGPKGAAPNRFRAALDALRRQPDP